MCGICGILHTANTENQIEKELSISLKSLRHRGYDGCGLSLNLPYQKKLSRRRIVSTKEFIQNFNFTSCNITSVTAPATITESNFRQHQNNRISGIAHTRYKTAGECTLKNTQPVFNEDNTISMVHNGQVEVYNGDCNVNGDVNVNGHGSMNVEDIFDSKYILEVFCREYEKTKSVFRSVKSVHDTVKGSYACIMLIKDLGIIAFRDPRGIRPLVFGVEKNNNDMELFPQVKTITSIGFASESVVLDDIGLKMVRDVKPGETIFVDLKGNVRYANYTNASVIYTPCLFEYIYLAEEHSIIDGIKVSEARKIMAKLLREDLNRFFEPIHAFVPVPNTPVEATKSLAKLLNIKYCELLYLPSMRQLEDSLGSEDKRQLLKNSRTFILPTQNKRELAVKDKFCVNVEEILHCQGKVIALVDDSIVRGTTMKILVKMVRELAQPDKLIVVSLAPPIRYENVFGIDIPDRTTLIAHNRTYSEIAAELGADEVIYGDLDNITQALKSEASRGGVTIDGYEHSVFKRK